MTMAHMHIGSPPLYRTAVRVDVRLAASRTQVGRSRAASGSHQASHRQMPVAHLATASPPRCLTTCLRPASPAFLRSGCGRAGQSANPRSGRLSYLPDGGRISRGGTLNASASFHIVRSVIERPAPSLTLWFVPSCRPEPACQPRSTPPTGVLHSLGACYATVGPTGA
jgi:hypothetical protein